MSSQAIKPNFEALISDLLEGDMKRIALEFMDYLKEHKMSVTRASGDAWKINYKSRALGRILWLKKGSWTLCPYADYTNEFESFMSQANMQEVIMKNLFPCHRCHPHSCKQKTESEEAFIGHKKTYFGNEVNNMCKHWDAVFRNPDEAAIACVKRMLDFRKGTITAS